MTKQVRRPAGVASSIEASTTASSRPKRQPLGMRNRLTFAVTNQDPNYHYRVINDKDDRIAGALEGGYEFVESDARLGDPNVGDSSPMGSRVMKSVGNNTNGYLMRIPMEYYEEDQAVKMAAVDETEAATKPRAEKGQYGPGLIHTTR